MKQGVAITGRNRNHTGPPCNVGRPRARPGAADCPRARRPAGSVTERQRAKQYWPIGRASNNHLSVPLSFGGSCTGCQRVDFKLGSITFRAIDNGVPSYLASDILYSQDVALRQHNRTTSSSRFIGLSPTFLCIFSAPVVWNNILAAILRFVRRRLVLRSPSSRR